jgi:hypothetical protein
MVNVAKKFMNVGYHSMFWTHPCLQCIMRSRVPVALVWGGDDNIMPLETGRITVELCGKLGKVVGLSVVEGAGHTPFHFEGGKEFAEKVRESCENIQQQHRTNSSDSGSAVDAIQSDSAYAAGGRNRFSDVLVRNHIRGLLDETYALECAEEEAKRNHSDTDPETELDLIEVDDSCLLHHKHEHKYINTTRWVSSFSFHATRENLDDMYEHLHSSVDRIAAAMAGRKGISVPRGSGDMVGKGGNEFVGEHEQ